jgi:hypothetical protein
MNDQKVKEKAIEAFKEQLFAKLGTASLKATTDYQSRMKYTGGYLSSSLVVAYSAGVNQMLNILLKEMTNVETEEIQLKSTSTGDNNGVA